MKRYIKRDIPDSEDWKTNTDNDRVNAFREIMAYNNQFVDDPYVGIFWYDPEEDDLFGVYSSLAEDMKFYESTMFGGMARTCRPLHYSIWQKECNRGRDKRFQTMDYTKYPRGRVFEVQGQGFVVCVGSWINDYPSVKELVLEEFQLPDDTEFLIDSHWELGHGWSDKDL